MMYSGGAAARIEHPQAEQLEILTIQSGEARQHNLHSVKKKAKELQEFEDRRLQLESRDAPRFVHESFNRHCPRTGI
jgi:hypothetical protein